jgi:hypothetical protein
MTHKQIAAGSGIRVYRRHSEDCDKNAAYLKCGCPVWIQFQREGKQIRESAKTRDLEKAMVLVRKVERELKGEIPTTSKITILPSVDEGRKRVLGIMASILAARKLAQYDAGTRVPATMCAIADAVKWAEEILKEIDRRWPSNTPR